MDLQLDPRQMRATRQIILTGCMVGLIYPIFGDGFESIIPFINGGLIGLLTGIGFAFFEVFYFPKVQRKIPFFELVILKTFLYTLMICFLILTVISISRALQYSVPLSDFFNNQYLRHFIIDEDFKFIFAFTSVATFALIFIRQISRKLGPGIL